VNFLMGGLEDAAGDPARQREYVHAMSRLLLLDTLYLDLQTIVASCAHAIGDGFPALPEGPLRERYGALLVFLGKLGGTELREVIHDRDQMPAVNSSP
jgi:hypothetical protein